jgi:hypothetical protein
MDLESIMRYYPGDEWVDWWAVDLFAAHHILSPDVNAFVERAAEHRFPVMIGESTPRYIGTDKGLASWNLWFKPYFDFIRRHANVKAFCYINWNWDETRWKWGEGRFEKGGIVLEKYRNELAKPWYIHGPVEF